MPNLLVNIETLEVKLIDFGCGDLLKNTSNNTYCGIPARYCPPEYIKKGEYHGEQAKVWSLGVLVIRMIISLFPDSSDIDMMDADAWLQPAGFSEECCRFIQGCLKSVPEQRLHLEAGVDWGQKVALDFLAQSSLFAILQPFAKII